MEEGIKKDLEELSYLNKKIDVENITGKYILIGKFMNDCKKNPQDSFQILHYDFYTIHEAFLAEFIDSPNFEETKEILLEFIDFLRGEVASLTVKKLNDLWKKAVENAKEHKNDIIKLFSKKTEYFT